MFLLLVGLSGGSREDLRRHDHFSYCLLFDVLYFLNGSVFFFLSMGDRFSILFYFIFECLFVSFICIVFFGFVNYDCFDF